MTTQVYRELRVLQSPNGALSVIEVWRGSPEEYKPQVIPPNTLRYFEMYIHGSGWFRVDQPKFTNSLGTTNPQQDLLE